MKYYSKTLPILTYLFLSLLVISCSSEKERGINLHFDNKNIDKIILGYYIDKTQQIVDSISISSEGYFKLADSLPNGVYFAIAPPKNKQFNFFVDTTEFPTDIYFHSKISQEFIDTLKTTSNINNTFIHQLKSVRNITQKQQKIIKDYPKYSDEEKENSKGKYLLLIREKYSLTKSFLENKNKTLRTFWMYSFNCFLEEFQKYESEEKELEKLKEYSEREYYKYLDLSDQNLHHYSNSFKFFDHHINHHVSNSSPEILFERINTLLNNFTELENEEVYKFLLTKFTTKYRMSFETTDKVVYALLVDKYYSDGEAYWVNSDKLDKMIKVAQKIKTENPSYFKE